MIVDCCLYECRHRDYRGGYRQYCLSELAFHYCFVSFVTSSDGLAHREVARFTKLYNFFTNCRTGWIYCSLIVDYCSLTEVEVKSSGACKALATLSTGSSVGISSAEVAPFSLMRRADTRTRDSRVPAALL